MVPILVKLLEFALSASSVKDHWGAVCEDSMEMDGVVWCDEMGDSGQDDIRVVVHSNMLATDVVVDGCEVTIKVEKT